VLCASMPVHPDILCRELATSRAGMRLYRYAGTS